MLKNLLLLSLTVFLISSCANGGLFESDKAPHPGKREPVFVSSNELKSKSSTVNTSSLAKPTSIKSWPVSNNFQSLSIQNIKFNDNFDLIKQVNVSWNKENNSLPPIIDQGAIFVFHGNLLSKYNLETLELIWTNSNIPNSEAIGGSLTIKDKKLFLADGTNSFRCFSADTGELIWQYTCANAIRATPFIKDGIIYVITIDNSVYAIHTKSGTHQWVVLSSSQAVINSPVGNSITASGNVVIVGQTNGNIEFLDINSGEKLTELAPSFSGDFLSNLAGGFTQPLLVKDPNLYFIDDRHQMTIFNSQTGEFQTRTSIPQANYFWVNAGYSFVLSSNNIISALDNQSGNIIWQREVELSKDDKFYPPMIINSQLMLFSKLGLVHTHDLKTGNKIDIFSLGQTILTAPVVADDKLVAISGNGKLSVWN